MSFSVEQILAWPGCELFRGSKAAVFENLREPSDAESNSLVFCINRKYIEAAWAASAGVLVVDQKLLSLAPDLKSASAANVIVSQDAYLSFALATQLFVKNDPSLDWGPSTLCKRDEKQNWIHSSASIDASVRLGSRVRIHENVVVGPDVEIGDDAVLFPGVVVYPRCKIGRGTRVHAHAVIGSDGFGYARSPLGPVKIWHLGKVIIGNFVEIGPHTCIDRGTLHDTVIEDGSKIDNLVQIGHNVHLERGVIACAQVGLAGHAHIGEGAILAGQAGIADKITVGKGAVIGPQSGASKDVAPGEQMINVLMPRRRQEWWKLNALFDKLPEIYARLKALEKGRDS